MHMVNITIVSIHRGIAENYYKNTVIRRIIRDLAYRNSDLVLYRDIKMKKIFAKKNKIKNKAIYDYNKVKISPLTQNKKKEGKTVLFLNAIRAHRRLDLVIASVPMVKNIFSDVVYYVVGCRNENEYNYVYTLADKYNVKENVVIHYWTNNPRQYYENAAIFLFPSDYVFCNYSLLESMERGVPAIVADVEDADRIIEHGVNGFLAKQNAEDLAAYIIKLLSDEELRGKMGKAARQTIIDKFNDDQRMETIYNLLLERYKDVIEQK